MYLETIVGGPLRANAYLVAADGRKTCIVIDPVDGKKVFRHIEAAGFTCEAILATHGHFDHVWGAAELKELTGAKVYCHRLDAPKMTNSGESRSVIIGRPLPECEPDVLLEDEQILSFTGLTLRVLHTPGHSAGSVCYEAVGENCVFSGDTVFHESVGRTDFPGGSHEEMLQSLKRISAMPEETRLYPGHSIPTDVAHERMYNPYMRLVRED